MHQFRKLDENIELRPILDDLTARPPLAYALSEETEKGVPEIFGGSSVALARALKIIEPGERRTSLCAQSRRAA